MIVLKKLFYSSFGLLLFARLTLAQTASEPIRLNQVGFYPEGRKKGSGSGKQRTGICIEKTLNPKKLFLKGNWEKAGKSQYSGKEGRIADFSSFQKKGNYVLEVTTIGTSYPFEIKPEVHKNVAVAAIRGYYYQRASVALPEKFAGNGHVRRDNPDDKILIHPSAASPERPEMTVISSPRGWYDAGDYNKYIVNSGITMATLLSVYEDFPGYFKNAEYQYSGEWKCHS